MPIDSEFLHPFYIANALALGSYAVVRQYVDLGPLSEEWFGMNREVQILLVSWSCVSISLWFSTASWETWVARVLQWGRLHVFLVVYSLSWRLAVWYGLLFLLLSVALRPPAYAGPSNVHEMTLSEFSDTVLGDRSGQLWLVMFCASWASNFLDATRQFARLSLKFAAPPSSLRMASVNIANEQRADVGVSAAADGANSLKTLSARFQIESSPIRNKDMPTLLIIRNGELVPGARLPVKVGSRTYGPVLVTEARVRKLLSICGELHAPMPRASVTAPPSEPERARRKKKK